jgi:hypothetical protein
MRVSIDLFCTFISLFCSLTALFLGLFDTCAYLSLLRNLLPATHLAVRGLARYKKLTAHNLKSTLYSDFI